MSRFSSRRILDDAGLPVNEQNPLFVNANTALHQAIHEIPTTYGDTVSVETKGKSLLKFGRNLAVAGTTTGSTIMTMPSGIQHETYVNTNTIDTVTSTDNTDAQTLTVEGHTILGNDLSFVVQTVVLTGQTQATLPTPIARASKIINEGATDVAGDVYVYEQNTSTNGIPEDSAKVHIMMRANHNHSEKAATSISSVDYWLITNVYGSVLQKTSAFADVELQVRLLGGVFREIASFGVVSGSVSHFNFDPYLIIRPNSDIRLTADGSATLDVSGGMQGYLAIIV